MRDCVFEVVSGMYSEPVYARGQYEETDSKIKYIWNEKHNKEDKESVFHLTCDKATKDCQVVRNGDVDSVMDFKSGKKTKGTLNTAYGIIDVEIDTEYINLPGALSNTLEIRYGIGQGEDKPIKNLFMIKRLLQND
ncbi:MAG: DUF1934 domain-containing protein [Saccharofermentans sp.]|nr:DUF1934 domain-containing protein [Saccharofermentans sp.]